MPRLEDSLGMTLLTPTRIYSRSVMGSIESGIVLKGIVHITGGGFYENIPRVLPEDCAAHIDRSTFEIPAIFDCIRQEGEVDDMEMFRIFNMGIGMVVIVSHDIADQAVKAFKATGEIAKRIGVIVKREKGAVIIK
jgi:phosphoribosylformylglycinamidine cyclo-ligase